MSIFMVDYGKFSSTAYRFFIFGALLAAPSLSNGAIQGACSDCHTMHNSQNNVPMIIDNPWDTPGEPHDQLLRASCLGCHAQGAGAENIVVIGSGLSRFPQVYHDDLVNGDLAGGNFWYINNGPEPSPGKGHNIGALTGNDPVLLYPPGGVGDAGHSRGTNIMANELTCAGDPNDQGHGGCHGHRGPDITPPVQGGIKGAHHNNLSGTVDPLWTETQPGHSYRFLVGVKGYEDPDWQATKSESDHNEYWGLTAPVQMGCASNSCHSDDTGVRPPDGTISQFCATCHGNFHTLSTFTGGGRTTSDGIGLDAISPFIRHPTDLVIPDRDEYAAYTTYNLDAPVARTTPAGINGPSSTVNPGSDAVMCLSCHYSHGGPYNDMLRWSYTTMVAGSGSTYANTGCFTCHTTKN